MKISSGRMSTQDEKIALLQGTLDLLILRTLLFRAAARSGYRPSHSSWKRKRASGRSRLTLPALQRLESKELIRAEWGISENNRKARFYTLTAQGKKELNREVSR